MLGGQPIRAKDEAKEEARWMDGGEEEEEEEEQE